LYHDASDARWNKGDDEMQTSNNMNEAWGQRIVILALVAVLAIAAAYVWGTVLSAGSDRSPSPAAQYAGSRSVAAVRALDLDLSAAPAFTGLRGVAAVRAADEGIGR
jgi:hypothetical protein